MRIEALVWFGEIVEKLEGKHNVQPYEVEEVFVNHPLFRFVEKGYRAEENVYAAMGQTDVGRSLVVFFVCKKDKKALVLTARDMTNKKRKRHEQE